MVSNNVSRSQAHMQRNIIRKRRSCLQTSVEFLLRSRYLARPSTDKESPELADSGIISSSIAQTDFVDRFGNGVLADNTAGGIVSSFTGGAIVSSLLLNVLSDRYGRRAAIFIGALLACVGGALQGGANSVATVIVGRVIAGLAVGLLSATIPNYCAEVAPPKTRALLAGLQQWNIGLGFASLSRIITTNSPLIRVQVCSRPMDWVWELAGRRPFQLEISTFVPSATGLGPHDRSLVLA